MPRYKKRGSEKTLWDCNKRKMQRVLQEAQATTLIVCYSGIFIAKHAILKMIPVLIGSIGRANTSINTEREMFLCVWLLTPTGGRGLLIYWSTAHRSVICPLIGCPSGCPSYIPSVVGLL